MSENESGILIHQGFLYRLSEHKKIWNLRGIYVYQGEDADIEVEIVKHDEITSFVLGDVEDAQMHTTDEFNNCMYLYIDGKVVTLAATSSLNELETMLAMTASIFFAKIDDEVLEGIFFETLMSLRGNDTAITVNRKRLPIILFQDQIARAELLISLVDVARRELNESTSADDCNFLAHIVILFLKLVSQVVVAALCNPEVNPAFEAEHNEGIHLLNTPRIVFRISHALVNVDVDRELFLSVNLLPCYLFDALRANQREKSLLSLMKKGTKHPISLSSSWFEILKSVQFGLLYNLSNIRLVCDIRESIFAAMWLKEDIEPAYDEYLHDINISALRKRFKNATLLCSNRGSPHASFLFKFVLLPQPAEEVEVLLKQEALQEQLIQKQEDVINYIYHVKTEGWNENIIEQLAIVISEYNDEIDFQVLMVSEIYTPQLSLIVFSQDLDAPSGVASCYNVRIVFEIEFNKVRMLLSASLLDKTELQRKGKLSEESSEHVETVSVNESSNYDAISTIEENSDSFEHISNFNELKIRLSHQLRSSGCHSFNADHPQQTNSRYRLSIHQVTFSELIEDAHDSIFELSYSELFHKILRPHLIGAKARLEKKEVCTRLASSISRLQLPDSEFIINNECVRITINGCTITIICDYTLPGNLLLFSSAKLLHMIMRIGKRYKREVILANYNGERFHLDSKVVHLNFIVFEDGRACLLKGLENYM